MKTFFNFNEEGRGFLSVVQQASNAGLLEDPGSSCPVRPHFGTSFLIAERGFWIGFGLSREQATALEGLSCERPEDVRASVCS